MPEDTEIDESSDVASENDYDDTDLGKDDQDDMMAENKLSEYGNGSPDAKKPKLDPKDPLRPRRKKARRACYACQRAHLTCGMLRSYYCHEHLIYPMYYCSVSVPNSSNTQWGISHR